MGFEVWLKSSSRFDDLQGYFPEVFVRYGVPGSRSALIGIGPKIKLTPIKKLKRFSVQSTVLVPLAKDLESRNSDRPFLEIDRNALWLTQIFFDKPIGNQFQIFAQFAPWVSFTRNSFRENSYVETPTSLFFSWFATDRITLYLQSEYWPTHYNDQRQKFESFYSWFVQSGSGIKYQLLPGFLEVEALYTNFWLGSDGQGAGETFNLGLRIIN